MTKEQQRIAIAEWCGWSIQPSDAKYEWTIINNGERWGLFDWLGDEEPTIANVIKSTLCIPDYLNDLNEMAGVLRDKVCGDVCLEKAFIKHLNAILERRADDDAGPVVCEYEMAQITAPAGDFAEALLKTIGKWIES